MKRKANKNNMKICLVGSSGGHLTHLYMLKPFWKDKDRFWVTFDKEDARSILEGEKMYPCYYPTNRSLKAGPASFIMPLQIGKTPIVVPRQHRFDEHVNDHQVEFARNVAERMGTIIPVEDISTLGDVIKNYDDIVAKMGHGMSSNNEKFCRKLEEIVDELVR